MESPGNPLLNILQIGHDASIRGVGLSLRDAIAQSGYKALRPSFTAADLVPLLQENRHFVQQWLDYSGDKRTNGGWYLLGSGQIGEAATNSTMRFPSMELAVANYVIRELDFWAGAGS